MNEIITHATSALSQFLFPKLSSDLETIRLARTTYALYQAGCDNQISIGQTITDRFLGCQQSDGGWSDPEETAWVIASITFGQNEKTLLIQSATNWLHSVRNPTGGWGRHPRDRARIPITAMVSTLVPEVVRYKDKAWLIKEWSKDFNGPVKLSYKAGFFLLTMAENKKTELIAKTIEHITKDQNEDGGFAPWKGHPMGSDPWSTGVVLWGLSKWIDYVDVKVIEKAIDWLKKSQLPNGYWSYHYLDDGTSIALIGLMSAIKVLLAKDKPCVQ